MRRQIISFLALFILAATSVDAMAQDPDIAGRKAEIEDMLTRGRWGEAHEALVALERDINPIDNRLDVEWVRFEKVRTSVELGVADAEAMMKNFIENHPSSIYRNDMLFMLASYYTDNGMMADGEHIFAEVDYKALDARERERYDMRMGYIRFTEADYPRAKTHLKRVSKISDYYPHAQYYIAYMHYLDGEFISAEEIFSMLASTEEYGSLAPSISCR